MMEEIVVDWKFLNRIALLSQCEWLKRFRMQISNHHRFKMIEVRSEHESRALVWYRQNLELRKPFSFSCLAYYTIHKL